MLCFPFVGSTQQAEPQIGQDYMRNVVTYLASDYLKGRGAGTQEEGLAASYIAKEFSTIKSAKISIQPFEFALDDSTYHSQNILAFISNHAAETVVITAHYDHIGMGGKLSLSHVVNQIHNGADDNASGVALMLSLAQHLSRQKTNYNYLFIGYGAHEVGLYGSAFFAENQFKKQKKIRCVVNFDMMGRLNTENKLYYDCTADLTDRLDTLKIPNLTLTKSTSDRINTLDTKWLVAKNIPCITLSTGKHSDYHKITDDVQYINFEGMLQIQTFLLDWLTSDSFNS